MPVTEGFEDPFQKEEEEVLTYRMSLVGEPGFEKIGVSTQTMIFSVIYHSELHVPFLKNY